MIDETVSNIKVNFTYIKLVSITVYTSETIQLCNNPTSIKHILATKRFKNPTKTTKYSTPLVPKDLEKINIYILFKINKLYGPL